MMVFQSLRTLVLALIRIITRFSCCHSSLLNLVRSLFLFHTSHELHNAPRKGAYTRTGYDPGPTNTTIACSLFHQPSPSSGSANTPPSGGRLSPLRLVPPSTPGPRQLTSSPEEMSPPQQIPKFRLNDNSSDSDIESRGRPPSATSSRARSRRSVSISPSFTRVSAPSSDPSPSPSSLSHGAPRSFSHSRSPSRTGTLHHITRSPTIAHRRDESLPKADVSLPVSAQFQPPWLKAPAPLRILEPVPLPRHLGSAVITPIHPEGLSRGDCRILIDEAETSIQLEPMTRSFEPLSRPEGWTQHFHPEGVVYFSYKYERIYTDAYIYDNNIYKHLQSHLEVIQRHLSTTGHRDLLNQCDLVLDLIPKNEDKYDKKMGTYSGDYVCQYYLVDHARRSIFWLDLFHGNSFESGVRGVNCKTHLRHEIEAQYWLHCQLFPSSVKLELRIIHELRDIILHNLGDTLNQTHSTSPFGQEDLNKSLKWVNTLAKNFNVEGPSLGASSLLGRLMFCFTRERFYHFYGQPAVRVSRDLSVCKDTGQRTWLIHILSPLLLSAPAHHLTTLEKIWVDQIMHVPAWKALSRRVTHQWKDFILYATVTLNADVAFLSIQSIDTNDISSARHPAQIACYLSIVFSIGSIVTGLLLLKSNRTEFNVRYLYEKHHSISAVETLAILHSLPYALLIWAMLAFLVAFCCICFIDTTAVTRASVGGAFGVTGLLFVWCIRRVSGMETQQQLQGDHEPIWNWLTRHSTDARGDDA